MIKNNFHRIYFHDSEVKSKKENPTVIKTMTTLTTNGACDDIRSHIDFSANFGYYSIRKRESRF